LGWAAAGVVFALAVAVNLGHRNEGRSSAYVGGQIFTTLVIGLGLGLLSRWLYLRFRRERRTKPKRLASPWVLVAGTVTLLVAAAGRPVREAEHYADQARAACAGEPLSEVLRPLPSGLAYTTVAPGVRERMDRAFAGPVGKAYRSVTTARAVANARGPVALLLLIAAPDTGEVMRGVADGAREASASVARVRVGGRNWMAARYAGAEALFSTDGCRVVAVYSQSRGMARRIAAALARDD
jgi:hypothetical protein